MNDPEENSMLAEDRPEPQVEDGDVGRDRMRQQEVDDAARERRIADLNETLETIADALIKTAFGRKQA